METTLVPSQVVVDPEMDKERDSKWAAEAQIELKTGERFTNRVDFCKGDPKNPLTYEEIKSKFKTLTNRKFSDERSNDIIETVEKLEELQDMRELARLLVP